MQYVGGPPLTNCNQSRKGILLSNNQRSITFTTPVKSRASQQQLEMKKLQFWQATAHCIKGSNSSAVPFCLCAAGKFLQAQVPGF
jgi:hypothetical protein